MKKITCMALMAAALLMATPAQAQFSWGIKGGVNLGSNDLMALKDKSYALDASNYTGFFIGPKAEVRIPILGFGIEAAAMYAQKGMS
ncbi:MAG: porin family protein, partial [Bacteroidaceae bacterium]|nr:porin family protein [Bacteroidaceae bacterium]